MEGVLRAQALGYGAGRNAPPRPADRLREPVAPASCDAAAGRPGEREPFGVPAEQEGGSFVYPFSAQEFGRVRELIYREAGIALAPGKKDMVYGRLARRVRARQLDCFADYLALVERGDRQELEQFINALTTNMTSFFREPHHFGILAEHLERQRGRSISIWSCAASSGEEPYSIAMTALEALGSSPPVRILATDIDTGVLAKARAGIYPLDQLQKLPPQQLKRFFLKGEGKNAGLARIREELRRLVSFRRLNLLEEGWPMTGRFDFIFCRNVMIYFDKKTQHELLGRMAARLNPGGLLFVGHSESFHSARELFRICGNTVYALKG